MQSEQPESSTPNLQVSNPFQAASEIFYKPKDVFDALAVKDNWSWIPFIILTLVIFFPPYLYFNVVDFEWWRTLFIEAQMPDASPIERENAQAQYPFAAMQWSFGIMTALSPIIFHLIIGFYYTLVTRNDDKSVHGFTDWYGAMWWISMPTIVGSLVSLVLISLQSPGAELSQAVLAPLSLAYAMGTEVNSPWFNFLMSIRLDFLWSIWLGSVCLVSWTNFTQTKALIVAFIPSIVIWTASVFFAAT